MIHILLVSENDLSLSLQVYQKTYCWILLLLLNDGGLHSHILKKLFGGERAYRGNAAQSTKWIQCHLSYIQTADVWNFMFLTVIHDSNILTYWLKIMNYPRFRDTRHYKPTWSRNHTVIFELPSLTWWASAYTLHGTIQGIFKTRKSRKVIRPI